MRADYGRAEERRCAFEWCRTRRDFVTEITSEFMLVLDGLRPCGATSHGCARSVAACIRSMITIAPHYSNSNEVIPARCEKVMIVRVNVPLGATKDQFKPSQKTFFEKRLHSQDI